MNYICLSCGWIGKEKELIIVKRMGEYDPIYMDEHDCCPNCESAATEEVD